ncbi:hypothetical protein UPYG_G00271970 [Umbra pygmaea]|uniref:AP-4 complex subunit epsilon-1 C-terminal domain-containing protein n=1 Tax=Umbra pygmaea TaxID=75934 RepID=A0ABD0WAZ6_UMBPY
MNSVFCLGGDMIQPDIPNNFLRLLADGSDSVEEDQELRLFAVDSYVTLLQGETARLPQRFLQVISWVLGEFSHLRKDPDASWVMRLLAKLLDQKHISMETRSWILSAMTKLCSSPGCSVLAKDVGERFSGSLDTVLRQRAHELMILSQDAELRARVLPKEGRPEHLEVDSSLSFLDGFVSEALAAGAAPYKPPHQRQEELAQEKALTLEPYSLSLPVSLSACNITDRLTDRQSPTRLSISSGLSGNSNELSHKGGSTALKLDGVRRVWGKGGYQASQQHEAVDETPPPHEELPSPVQTLQSPPSQSKTPSPETDQDKRQLASSLFIGLESQSSVCLMGRAEPAPQRFRRKPRGGGSLSGASEPSSDSSHSSTGAALDNLLLSNTPDSTAVASQNGRAAATWQPNSQPTLGHPIANGNPTVQEAGVPISVIRANGTEAVVSPTDPETRADSNRVPGRVEDLPLSSHMPPELCGLARSELTRLCPDQDPSLALSACRVYTEEALVLVVFIHNNTDSALQQMALQLTSSELEISCASSRLLEEVKGQSVGVCQYSVVMKRISVRVELSGLLSYQRPPGQPQARPFSLSLSLKHFIRPLAVSTGEYGKMWLSFSHDVKQNLRLVTAGDRDPLSTTLDMLKEKLHLHVVDIIGSEGIVACRVLQGRSQPCLLHCRVHADALAVWLRSPVPELPDSLLYHCQKALTEA